MRCIHIPILNIRYAVQGKRNALIMEGMCEKGKRSLAGGIYSIPEVCHDKIIHPMSPEAIERMKTGVPLTIRSLLADGVSVSSFVLWLRPT